MRRDSRLWVALHVLLHMSEMDRAATSEALGPLMGANPVVLRRTLAGLRDAGIVRSEKGHGGGWSLSRDLDAVTLADVYAALGVTTLFTIGQREPRPRCRLEQAVNRAIEDTLTEAEALLMARLGSVTVADVLAEARPRSSRRSRKESRAHA
jgi:DNA-binding IscR family transcriptional regulator